VWSELSGHRRLRSEYIRGAGENGYQLYDGPLSVLSPIDDTAPVSFTVSPEPSASMLPATGWLGLAAIRFPMRKNSDARMITGRWFFRQ